MEDDKSDQWALSTHVRHAACQNLNPALHGVTDF